MKYLLILLILLITGCASNSNQEFPDAWAKLPKSNSNICPDVSGAYENIATTIKGESGLNLAWLIIPSSKEVLELNSIEFTLDPLQESLRITAHSENGAVVDSTLFKSDKDFFCEKGSLIIENSEFVNRDGVIAKNWKSYEFAKTADGLVMHYVDSATGLFFLVPVIGSHKYWYLYKQKS